MANKKQTSTKMASLASKVLRNQNTSKIQKSLAASALSQKNKGNQTGSEMEENASKVLMSNKYNNTTKSLAATVLSQSNRKR